MHWDWGLTHKLRQRYLNSVTGFTGIKEEDMDNQNQSTQQSMRDILQNIEGVELVEKSINQWYDPQWLLIIQKAQQKKIQNHLTHNTGKIYLPQEGQTNIVPARRIDLPSEKTTGNRVCTYAETLMQRFRKKEEPDEILIRKEAKIDTKKNTTQQIKSPDNIPKHINQDIIRK